ncbi:MAG: ABC-2 family transporter protein [Anaerolineales bacterium]|nr:ABC-2 family transporter protein [Anaerolineales bacterium]
MRSLHLAAAFARASTQQELAYRSNFFISVLHSLLNLATGLLGLVILFDQVELVRGWDFASSLTLLGVYLTLAALRDLFIGPSLDALAGMDGAIWRGTFDFSLLRPVNQQFLVSVQRWRPLVLFDLLLGLAVLGSGAMRLGAVVTWGHVTGFILALGAGVVILYSLLLGLTSLVFWGPGLHVHLALRQPLPDGALPGRALSVMAAVYPDMDHSRCFYDHAAGGGAAWQHDGRNAGGGHWGGDRRVCWRVAAVLTGAAKVCERLELRVFPN